MTCGQPKASPREGLSRVTGANTPRGWGCVLQPGVGALGGRCTMASVRHGGGTSVCDSAQGSGPLRFFIIVVHL